MLFMPSVIISITSNRAGSLSLLIFGLLLSKMLSNHELFDATLNDGVSLLIQRGAGFLSFEWTKAVGLEKLATYYRQSRNVFCLYNQSAASMAETAGFKYLGAKIGACHGMAFMYQIQSNQIGSNQNSIAIG